MHFEIFPDKRRNKDAIREYEREESKRIGNRLKKLAILMIPIGLIILWILFR